MLKEFREFLMRGNVIDLAVGIIIGAAFTAIVTSLVDDLITPIIGIFMGGVDFSGLSADIGDASLTYGNFIMALINFLIIAFVVFMLVRAVNKMKGEAEEAPAEDPGPSELDILKEIRDGLAK